MCIGRNILARAVYVGEEVMEYIYFRAFLSPFLCNKKIDYFCECSSSVIHSFTYIFRFCEQAWFCYVLGGTGIWPEKPKKENPFCPSLHI